MSQLNNGFDGNPSTFQQELDRELLGPREESCVEDTAAEVRVEEEESVV